MRLAPLSQFLVPQVHPCQHPGVTGYLPSGLGLAAVTAQTLCLRKCMGWLSLCFELPTSEQTGCTLKQKLPGTLPQQLVTIFAQMDCLAAA